MAEPFRPDSPESKPFVGGVASSPTLGITACSKCRSNVAPNLYTESLQLIVVVQVVVTVVHEGSGGGTSSVNNFAEDLVLEALLDRLGGGRGLVGHAFGLDGLVGLCVLAVGVHLVASAVADEVCEVLDSPRTAVLDGVRLVLCGEELDGREALNLVGDIVQGCVDLCDGDL